MKPLAVFGTSSDAGKTTLVMALCRIFADRGLTVAPFKAQNVSNNSAVTREGREISRAQCLQAEAARVEPSFLFNPVLLKSHGNGSVQVIVNGEVYQNQTIAAYYEEIGNLSQQVQQAFSSLQQDYDLVIAEGAGSPVELNLLHKDLSNTFVAKTFSTQNILVADIERGGVFASIYGTLELMDPVMRANLIGVVVNKFRGDRRFFDEGEAIIRERFGVPVLGVLPFQPLNIDMEDSQSLRNYQQRLGDVKIRVAVIAYPGLSNYNDLDVLMADSELHLELVHAYRPLDSFDMVLLPGSKTVIRDLQWLKQQGLFAEIHRFEKAVFGICGGYQMLCRTLHDPDALEHEVAGTEIGLGFIDDTVTYQSPKVLTRGLYPLFGHPAVKGYEIHCGRMEKYPLCYPSANMGRVGSLPTATLLTSKDGGNADDCREQAWPPSMAVGSSGSLPFETLLTSRDGGNADACREQAWPPSMAVGRSGSLPFETLLTSRDGGNADDCGEQAWPPSMAVGRVGSIPTATLAPSMAVGRVGSLPTATLPPSMAVGRVGSIPTATLPPSMAVAGTHVHGVFDDDDFRRDYFKAMNPDYQGYAYEAYREAEIQGFADMVAANLDIDAIVRAITG